MSVRILPIVLGAMLLAPGGSRSAFAADATLIGWNNLGMHCMDPDYGVYALLPPYNTLEAQLVDAQGRLQRDPVGVTVTYEAIADPTGSINSTSRAKSNFWDFAESLFGVSVPLDTGLTGVGMPGPANVPQLMAFDPARALFVAEGIPITPYDDGGAENSYPLMRLVARDAAGRMVAATDVVLPVSDELNCHACHASDTSPAARPFEGWVGDPDPERDTRLNILRLHDDREGGGARYEDALSTAGYAPGLYTSATTGRPVLCARCHVSQALPGSGLAGISPLTQAVHRRMANVLDPVTGMRLDDVANRSACYRCHPGAVTRCLRGAMGNAVAADGARAMQCQSCHGRMRDVADAGRTGWLDEPQCQSCHTGTALQNGGEIRYTSVFTPDGAIRRSIDTTFATNPDTPAPGLSLYRYSRGHGDLACEACHGATHAEYPSSQGNDNLQSLQLQGHVGMLIDCDTCHPIVPRTVDGGPHGLHPVGAAWVEAHGDAADDGGAQRCRACHGTDYRGTVLSRAQGDRAFETDFGRKVFWRGFQIGCYTCHLGPEDERTNPNRAPQVEDGAATAAGVHPIEIGLVARDADGDPLTLRVVSQPPRGTVGLQGTTGHYVAEPGFSGIETFTFTASDGSTDGNLATVVVTVTGTACPGDCDHSGSVAIHELVRGINIALGLAAIDQCDAFDIDADASVKIDELIQGIGAALHGCSP